MTLGKKVRNLRRYSNTLGENDEDKQGDRNSSGKNCHNKINDWLWQIRKRRLEMTWVSGCGTGNMGGSFTEMRTITGG